MTRRRIEPRASSPAFSMRPKISAARSAETLVKRAARASTTMPVTWWATRSWSSRASSRRSAVRTARRSRTRWAACWRRTREYAATTTASTEKSRVNRPGAASRAGTAMQPRARSGPRTAAVRAGACSRTWESRTRRARASPPPQTTRGWLLKISRKVTVQVTAAANRARVSRGMPGQGAALRQTRIPDTQTAACGRLGWRARTTPSKVTKARRTRERERRSQVAACGWLRAQPDRGLIG